MLHGTQSTLENFVFQQCSLLIGSASSLKCNESGCGVVHLGYARSVFWTFCDDYVFTITRSLKVANSRSLSPLLSFNKNCDKSRVLLFVHVGERCKLPTYHSLEGFQHIGIFQLLDVKLEQCVFWLADSFQAKVEGHHQQVIITSNVSSWKTLCSGNVHS